MHIKIIAGQLRNLSDNEDVKVSHFWELGHGLFRFANDESRSVFYKTSTSGEAMIVADDREHHQVTALRIEVSNDQKIVPVKGPKRIHF